MRSDDMFLDAGLAELADRVKKAKKSGDDAKKGAPEGVHGPRVGVRRVRAALSILAGTALSEGAVKKHERKLKRLFDALGEARDDDVLIERIRAIAKRRKLHADSIAALEKALGRERSRAKKR